MPDPDSADRARQRDLVRRGYDAISLAYRDDSGTPARGTGERMSRYADWAADLAALLPTAATVLDLGCGNGLPGARLLAERGWRVLGVDFSAVQVRRAAGLVPAARFARSDMTELAIRPASLDAIVSLYALIHVPLADQRVLLPRLRRWLRPGGYLLAIVGAERWTGVDDYLGAPMFWDHEGAETYLAWLAEAGLAPRWHRFIPEGTSGHTLGLAQAVTRPAGDA